MTHDEEEHSQPFPEVIWMGSPVDVPSEADALVVTLPAKPTDTLIWDIPSQHSEKKIIFELELGLFKDLTHPLDDSVQRSSLNLSLKEFQNKMSHLEPIGVILGRIQGEELFELSWSVFEREEFIRKYTIAPEIAALSPTGRLQLKIYALTRHIEFVKSLTDLLPDLSQPLLLIDCTSLCGKIEELLLYNQELFEPIVCVLKNSHFHQNQLSWDCNFIRTENNAHEKRIGIVLPEINHLNGYQQLKNQLETLDHYHLYPIAQEYLTTSWSQIDWLIVSSECCDSNTLRSLKGFIAAGGQVATLDAPLTEIPSISITEAIQRGFLS